ncbi:unnamed protein product [Arctogadus glacialis]
MNLQSAASGFLAFLLLIPALQSKADWKVTYKSSHICASKGSTVNINCTYEYPFIKSKSQSSSINLESLWFTKIDRNDPVNIEKETDYKGWVKYSCGKNQCTRSKCSGACTLRIRDLKPSDSAEYKFWITTAQTDWGSTGSPGVNLTVTDAPKTPSVTVSPSGEVEEGSSVTLSCSSDANPAAKYTWRLVQGT